MPCCFHIKRWSWEDENECQFDVPDDRLVAFGDQTYCPFHLPMATADGTPSPKAEWGEEKIETFNAEVFSIVDAARDVGARVEYAEADLSGVAFPGEISFGAYDGGQPLPAISFLAAEFSNHADFKRAAFSGFADFERATFSERTYFARSTFSKGVDFGRATFLERAYFAWTTFSGFANFERATFSKFAGFERVTFSNLANFSRATFLGAADFSGVGTETQTAYHSASDFGWADFSGAEFGAAVSFNNRRFTDTTNFRDAIFGKAPKFHNAVLHQDTDFTGARFDDFASDDAARNYRTLKLAMEQVRSRQEEAMFFALEQRSLRNQAEMPWTGQFASTFYEWAADYGQSFVRPVLWLLAFTIIFAGIYATVMLEARDLHSAAFAPCPFDYLSFTLKQTFRPFEVWSSRPYLIEPFECYGLVGPPLLLRLLATLQSLFTFAMVTLFLLALRKRFRMI